MRFSAVIKGLREGKRFHRTSWRSDEYIICKPNNQRVSLENSSYRTLLIEDYEATDWVEVTQ